MSPPNVKRLSRSIAVMAAVSWLCVFLSGAQAARLPIRIFTSADGLGSSFVDFIYRDSRGFMWFCTRDGLSRFDGSQFVTYQVGEKDSAPGIESIYETRDGMYWISTTGGTYRLDPSVASQPETSRPRLNAELITAGRGTFFEDSAGNLWIASGSPARIVIQDGKPVAERFELGLPGKFSSALTVVSIAEAQDHSIWMDTSWGLVRRLPSGRVIFFPYEETVNSSNSSMIVDKSGRLWVTRANRIFVVKPDPADSDTGSNEVIEKKFAVSKTIELKPEEPIQLPKVSGEIYEFVSGDVSNFVEESYAKTVMQSVDGDIWITAEDNLLQISGGRFHLHTAAEGLPNVMSKIAEDAAGNLWIGGQTGLARLDRNGLVTFGTGDGLNSSRIFSISESAEGEIFFGGRNFYLSRFDGRGFQTVRPNVSESSTFLWTSRFTYRARNGEWWILTSDKLYRFPSKQDFAELDRAQPLAIYGTAEGLYSDHVFQIFEDSGGDIWVSTRGLGGAGTGVSRLRKGDATFQRIDEGSGLPKSIAFSSAVEDSFGFVWFSFYEGGIARFDGERFTYFASNIGLPPGLISDVHLDKKGRLWIASSLNGVYRIDETSANVPVLDHIGTADGFSSDNIRTITEDKLGRMYFGTVRGVDRYAPDIGQFKHFSVNDGLAADFVVDSLCDRNGYLWFATNNGISRLATSPDEKASPPKVYIGSMRIAGVEQPISDIGSEELNRGEFAYTENNLQIDFFGLDFRAGETLRFQYKLEGANADWSAPSDQRSVTLANLSPASYNFLVRAVTSDGMVSERPASITFRILPPIWERWWFLLATALILGFVVVSLYRYRLAQLQRVNSALSDAKLAEEKLRLAREERLAELERIRSRIATDLHDDIGASLTQITVLSEVAQARARKSNGDGDGAGPLQKITEVSNELVGTMSDIVWSINPAKDHLSDLTQRMRRFASDLLSARGIALQFKAPDAEGDATIRSNARREVFLIFKESINNIVKHSGARNVVVHLDLQGSFLELRIHDDGNGFNADGPIAEHPLTSDSMSGNGVKSMRKRAAEMGGSLVIQSASNTGTTVLLHLPLAAIDVTVEPNRAI